MLGKLIKHEFKATYRIYAILFAGILMLAALTRLFGGFSSTAETGMGFVLTLMLYIMAVSSSAIIVLVFTIRRFYSNLLSNQAYLTLMLPVNAHQHLLAKILTTAVWYVGLVLTIFLSFLILFAGPEFIGIMEGVGTVFGWIFSISAEALGTSTGVIVFHILFIALSIALFQLSVLYLCTTIGGQSGTHKRMMGVLMYFAVYIASSITLSLITTALTTIFTPAVGEATQESAAFLLGAISLATSFMYLGGAIGFYFCTARRLTRNFNLQ